MVTKTLAHYVTVINYDHKSFKVQAKVFSTVLTLCTMVFRRHDIQHNDIQHFDTGHNDIQHNSKIQHYDIQHNVT
jgi:hypothetical protein